MHACVNNNIQRYCIHFTGFTDHMPRFITTAMATTRSVVMACCRPVNIHDTEVRSLNPEGNSTYKIPITYCSQFRSRKPSISTRTSIENARVRNTLTYRTIIWREVMDVFQLNIHAVAGFFSTLSPSISLFLSLRIPRQLQSVRCNDMAWTKFLYGAFGVPSDYFLRTPRIFRIKLLEPQST